MKKLNQQGRIGFSKISSFEELAQSFSYPADIRFEMNSNLESTIAFNTRDGSWLYMSSRFKQFGGAADHIDGLRGYCSDLSEGKRIDVRASGVESYSLSTVNSNPNAGAFLKFNFNVQPDAFSITRRFVYPDQEAHEWKYIDGFTQFSKH